MKRADVSMLFKELGRAGGLERAARMTAKQRSESAKKAAAARWSKAGGKGPRRA